VNCDNLTLTSAPGTIEDNLRRAGLCPVALSQLETAAIRNALSFANGNRTHAARSLGISVRTLQRKLKDWKEDGDGMEDGDIFLASFGGKRIECRSVEDAIAVNTADALSRNGDCATASEFQRLATVLTRYNCVEGAKEFSGRAARQRATDFLHRSVGYERPR
jgi:hypothetical protein